MIKLLWDGLTHYYLGYNNKTHAQRALTSLSTFGQLQPRSTIPERFRLECLNNRTLTAIQRGDLDEALACLKTGQQGANNLKSVQRWREVKYAYHLMLEQWPIDQRVKQLRTKNVFSDEDGR